MDAVALGRGLVKRCPACGEKHLFQRFFTLKETCPGCDLTFEREEGYWLGAMVVAMALVIIVFSAVFLVGVLFTWPDVPWTGLTWATIIANLVVPIVGYPWCKTVWMGIHHAFVPSNRHETHRPI